MVELDLRKQRRNTRLHNNGNVISGAANVTVNSDLKSLGFVGGTNAAAQLQRHYN